MEMLASMRASRTAELTYAISSFGIGIETITARGTAAAASSEPSCKEGVGEAGGATAIAELIVDTAAC